MFNPFNMESWENMGMGNRSLAVYPKLSQDMPRPTNIIHTQLDGVNKDTESFSLSRENSDRERKSRKPADPDLPGKSCVRVWSAESINSTIRQCSQILLHH